MKKLMLCFVVGIFMISLATAFEFDNIKDSYDKSEKKLTIKNSFLGIPMDTVAELTLDSDLNERVGLGEQKVAEFTIDLYEDYDNALKNMEFYDKKQGDRAILRDFSYKYKVIVPYVFPVYSSCDGQDNKTCEPELLKYEKIEKVYWTDFDASSELPKGNITIGIFTDVQEGDIIEWIPTFFGVRIDEWATWTASLNTDLISYYSLNETSGNMTDYVNSFDANCTGSPDQNVAGKISNGIDFSGAVGENCFANHTALSSLDGEVTWGGWFNLDSASATDQLISRSSDGAGRQRFGLRIFSDNFQCRSSESDLDQITVTSINGTTAGVWANVICRRNATHLSIWYNGTVEDAVAWDGTNIASITNWTFGDRGLPASSLLYDGQMDEIGIWNRSLSDSEISDLYNDGNGITYIATPTELNVTLVSPVNDSVVADTIINFTVHVNASINFVNVTYIIWNSTSLFNQTFVDTADALNFSNTLSVGNFSLDDYLWNVDACLTNGTCYGANLGNSTFEVIPISTLAEDWVNFTIEGSRDDFSINLSVLSGERISSIDFIYNGTEFASTFVEYATNQWFVNRTHNIPQVDAETNLSFQWNVTLENGFSQLTTEHNQTVRNFAIDNCSIYTVQIFNLTMFDEDVQSILAGGLPDNTSIKVDMNITNQGGSGFFINFSDFWNRTNPALICVNDSVENSTFRVDAVIEYFSLNRFLEFYNIQNFTLDNSSLSNNISLYNLNESIGTEFKITYKDDNFDTVPGAIIQIQRKYVDEGVFKTVEIPLISSAGYTIGHLVRNDIIYNLIVLEDGIVLDSFLNIVANCQNPTITECEININSFASSVQPADFSTSGDFSTTLTYNRTSREIESVFVIASGVPSVVVLNSTVYDGYGNQSICSDTLNAIGGTLSCTVPTTFGNQTMYVEITQDDVRRAFAYIPLIEEPEDIYGASLLFIGIIILLLFIGMGVVEDPKILGFMLIIGSIVLITMNVVSSAGWIGASATILWFIISVIIVMIKTGGRQ